MVVQRVSPKKISRRLSGHKYRSSCEESAERKCEWEKAKMSSRKEEKNKLTEEIKNLKSRILQFKLSEDVRVWVNEKIDGRLRIDKLESKRDDLKALLESEEARTTVKVSERIKEKEKKKKEEEMEKKRIEKTEKAESLKATIEELQEEIEALDSDLNVNFVTENKQFENYMELGLMHSNITVLLQHQKQLLITRDGLIDINEEDDSQGNSEHNSPSTVASVSTRRAPLQKTREFPTRVYYVANLNEDRVEALKNEYPDKKVTPYKKLSEFIVNDDLIMIPESWIKVFDYNYNEFSQYYKAEISEQTDKYGRKFQVKKDGRSKKIKSALRDFCDEFPTWSIEGFESDEKLAPSPRGVDEIYGNDSDDDDIKDVDVDDEKKEKDINDNIGDEKIESDAIEAFLNQTESDQKAQQDNDVKTPRDYKKYVYYVAEKLKSLVSEELQTSETPDQIYLHERMVNQESPNLKGTAFSSAGRMGNQESPNLKGTALSSAGRMGNQESPAKLKGTAFSSAGSSESGKKEKEDQLALIIADKQNELLNLKNTNPNIKEDDADFRNLQSEIDSLMGDLNFHEEVALRNYASGEGANVGDSSDTSQFEDFHEVALRNYESYHRLPPCTATIAMVMESSARLEGWYNYNPDTISGGRSGDAIQASGEGANVGDSSSQISEIVILESKLKKVINTSCPNDFDYTHVTKESESEIKILEQLGMFDVGTLTTKSVTEEVGQKLAEELGRIFAEFIVSVRDGNKMPIRHSYKNKIKGGVSIYNLCDKYFGNYGQKKYQDTMFNKMKEIFTEYDKSLNDDNNEPKIDDGRKSNRDYLKTRIWIQVILENLNIYLDENYKKIPIEKVEMMFHPTTYRTHVKFKDQPNLTYRKSHENETICESLYKIIYDTEKKISDNVDDQTTLTQYVTRQEFIKAVMKIENCFKVDTYYSYEDAYYFANKLGEWCFEVLNKYDIRIGTSTFGFMAGKLKENSIFRAKSMAEDEDEIADTFGLFLSHLKRDFFEEKDKFHYKNHYGDEKEIADTSKITAIEKIDKHYFNFNVESWLNMFEDGLKEGVLYREIEDNVEKLMKKKHKEKEIDDISEMVDAEMKYIGYRIWKLLPKVDESKSNTDARRDIEDKDLPNYKKDGTYGLKTPHYICCQEAVLKKNANFHLKKEKERLGKWIRDQLGNKEAPSDDEFRGGIIQKIRESIKSFKEEWLQERYYSSLRKKKDELETKLLKFENGIKKTEELISSYNQTLELLEVEEEKKETEIKVNSSRKEMTDLEEEMKEIKGNLEIINSSISDIEGMTALKNSKLKEITKDECLQSIIMKNDDAFTVKDEDIKSEIIGALDDLNIFNNKTNREAIFPDIICGFLDVYSREIYLSCKTSKKRFVAKFVGRRLDTPEKVYDMYLDWNEKEETMPEIMSILWVMDDQTGSMADCIKYFIDKEKSEESKERTNEAFKVLKKIWDSWLEKDADINYSKLHTKLIPIIPEDRLGEIRKIFMNAEEIEGPDVLDVYSGDYKLCKVKKLNEQKLHGKEYFICEILSQPGDKDFKQDFPVNISKSCFKKPTIKDDTGEEKDIEFDELKEFSDLHHVRLGSWNVACMNGTDIPTTAKDYDTKFKNITDVIFKSGCDIVALQELPNDLKIKFENEEERAELREFDEYFKDKEIGEEVTLKFDINIRHKITKLLHRHTGSEWELKYHQVNHALDSFAPGEKIDARKNRKEIYAFVYNTSVVRFQHPNKKKTNKIDDRRSLDTRFARCPIISNFFSNQLEFLLCTVHLPPTDKKIKTYAEIKDLGKKVFPGLIDTYGAKIAKSVIFLGDFNMGYMQKKKLLPRPTVDTWDAFHEHDYVPCIKTTTNVLQTMHYDNIWMHHSMADLTISKSGESNTGVIKVNEIEGTPFVIGSSLAEGFKKRVSDHNLVYVDLRNNEPMPWSEINPVLDR